MNLKKYGELKTKNIIFSVMLIAVFVLLVTAYLFTNNVYPDFVYGKTAYAFGSRSSNATFLFEDDVYPDDIFLFYKAKSTFISENSKDYEKVLPYIEQLKTQLCLKEVMRERAETEAGVVENVYYYSDKLPFYQIIYTSDEKAFFCDAVKVNLHVAYTDNGISIGCPFIYCGY